MQSMVGNLSARKGAWALASAEMGLVREILERKEAELVSTLSALKLFSPLGGW